MVDGKELRNVMGHFATGVTIVTTRDADGVPHGLTANAVASISLDPPLVMISIDRRAESFPHFAASKVFVVNILSAEQEALSGTFATSGGDKFAGVSYENNVDGVPLLGGSLAHVECRVAASHEAGDHVIHLGEVQRTQLFDAEPLLYYHGGYRRLGA